MAASVLGDAVERLRAQYAWWPQPGPQTAAYFAKQIDELFFGGAKYGGKSSYLIGDYVSDISTYGKHWQGILFRQSFPELQEIQRQCYEIFPRIGGEYRSGEREWRFPTGAALKMRYLERVEDFFRYNGFSFCWIGVDELPQWPSLEGYHMLKGCLRWADYDVPVKRIRATGNPGGPGHQEVRSWFQIDRYPRGMVPIYDERSKMWRVFVPSHVEDNQLGLARDPGYIDRLHAVGSPALVRAWLDGDWSIVTGAYFPEFGLRHILAPFEIPKRWTRFRAFDWGSARPFCCGWYAIADGESHTEIPRGAIVQYREYYGCEPGRPNTGIKLPADDVAREIVRLTGHEEIAYSVADPAIFTEDGGPSIAETMRKAGVSFRPADNKRIPGWEQVRMRFKGEDDRPMFYVFSVCGDLIRTVPSLQHDRHKPEDLDCFVAGTLIETASGLVPIEDIQTGDLVATPVGYRAAYIVGSPKLTDVVKIELSNGLQLCGTGQHKVYVVGQGLVALHDLDCSAILQGWNIKPSQNISRLTIAALSIENIRADDIINRMAHIWHWGLPHCIGKFIWILLGRFLKALLYTTRTVIRIIITLKTLRLLSGGGMERFICGKGLSEGRSRTSLKNGERRRTGKKHYAKMLLKCLREPLNGNFRAVIVGQLLRQSTRRKNIVPNAIGIMGWLKSYAAFAAKSFGAKKTGAEQPKHVRITAVGNYGVAPVYRLRVKQAHLYYANGVLVSNTDGEDHPADTLRYALMSRPYAPPLVPVVRAQEKTGADLIAETIGKGNKRGRRV